MKHCVIFFLVNRNSGIPNEIESKRYLHFIWNSMNNGRWIFYPFRIMSLSSLLSSKHTNTQTHMQTPAHTFYMATHKNCRHITYYLPRLASNFRFAFIFGCFFLVSKFWIICQPQNGNEFFFTVGMRKMGGLSIKLISMLYDKQKKKNQHNDDVKIYEDLFFFFLLNDFIQADFKWKTRSKYWRTLSCKAVLGKHLVFLTIEVDGQTVRDWWSW